MQDALPRSPCNRPCNFVEGKPFPAHPCFFPPSFCVLSLAGLASRVVMRPGGQRRSISTCVCSVFSPLPFSPSSTSPRAAPSVPRYSRYHLFLECPFGSSEILAEVPMFDPFPTPTFLVYVMPTPDRCPVCMSNLMIGTSFVRSLVIEASVRLRLFSAGLLCSRRAPRF